MLVAGSLATTVAGCNHKKKDDKTTKVCDALKKFTETNPIEIPYNTANPTAPASDPTVAKAIREQLKLKNPTIFTTEVVAGITFSNTPLQANTAVKVVVTYNKKETTIYVKEAENPDQAIKEALKKFNNEQSAITIPYQNPGARANDPEIAPKIKSAMTSRNPIFTVTVLTEISFNDTLLQENTAVSVQATYKNTPTTIYVKEGVDTTKKIYDALKDFNQKNPIEIPFYQKNPETPASDPAITKLIGDQLKLKNPTIFTTEVVAEITFSNTPLQPNTAVLVQATYEKKATPIYVKEADSSEAQDVINDLQKFNTTATAVEIDAKYAGKYADDYGIFLFNKAGDAIREYIIVNSSEIETEQAFKITFDHVQLKKDTPVTVKAIYKGKSTEILVKLKKSSKIEEQVKKSIRKI